MYHEAHVDYSQQHDEEHVSEAKSYSFTIAAVIWGIGAAASNSFLTATVVSLVPIIITHTRDNLLKYLCLSVEGKCAISLLEEPSVIMEILLRSGILSRISTLILRHVSLFLSVFTEREGEKKKKKSLLFSLQSLF